jgi:hypothetical protein
MADEKESLFLKWGTLKEWEIHSVKGRKLLKEYFEIGASFSTMAQRDTPRQKEIICELIDGGNFEHVWNDWEGEEMTKEEAKKYIMDYGANA